jgi:hypothetical protein
MTKKLQWDRLNQWAKKWNGVLALVVILVAVLAMMVDVNSKNSSDVQSQAAVQTLSDPLRRNNELIATQVAEENWNKPTRHRLPA